MLSQKLESAANAATIVVSILLSIILVRIFLLPPHPAPRAAARAETEKGKDMKPLLKDVDWSKTDRTAVFVLSTTCHFCNESAPFLRRLVEAAAHTHSVRTIAVLPQPVVEAQQYLSSEGVHVDEVRQAELTSIGVGGTPTWLILDKAGIVTHAWEGKLQRSEEEQVLRSLNDGHPVAKLLE